MGVDLSTIQGITIIARRSVCLLSLCILLSSCAPINNNFPSSAASPIKKSLGKTSYSPSPRQMHFSSRSQIARLEAQPTILGFKVPQALSFSPLTRFLATKDDSLDQAPPPLPSFPTVTEAQDLDNAIDSAAIEDERSMLLLSEAERFAEFSENKSLSELARGSLNKTMELAAPAKELPSFKLSQRIIVILALCVGVLVACGYFVVSFLLDDLRVRNAPRFGSMQ